jgi:hypothetical protein
MRIFLFFIMMMPVLFAYIDSDLDGVADNLDQCPNTPITELVDIKGCSIQVLKSDHRYDLIVGESFSQIDYNTNEKTDTYATTLQVDYFYKNFSVQAATAYYTSKSATYSSSGLTDSTLAAYYLVPVTDSLRIRLGAGLILPTYDSSLNNNKTDYLGSISATYSINRLNIFGGYNYTVVNDDDAASIGVKYQDTNAYSAGLGYYMTQKWYTSAAYYQADAIYTTMEDIKNVSLYNFYSFDKNWFGSLSYAYGLSDSASDHTLALRLGYAF